MRRVVALVILLLITPSFVFAGGDNGNEELFDPDTEPLTDSSGCADTDGEDVLSAGMVMTWPDITTRDNWLFNWDNCIQGEPNKIQEVICSEGTVKRVVRDCPDGTVCNAFVRFESPVLESFIATWVSLMISEGKTQEEIATEISYICDMWQEASACVPTESDSDIPILILPPHLLDFLHGLHVNFGSFGNFFPRDRFAGTENRILVDGTSESRIITVSEGIIIVREDKNQKVENTIRIKKKAADAIAQAQTEGQAQQVFLNSFKKGDITFTGRSLKVKFAGFAHKVSGWFH